MKVRRMKYITRKYIKAHPRSLFLFGDNLKETGFGGQAKEMRGERNSYGIVTKNSPLHNDNAYLNDEYHWILIHVLWDLNFSNITKWLKESKYSEVVIPENGLGTGLAKMPEKCPQLFAYLQNKIKELENEMCPS